MNSTRKDAARIVTQTGVALTLTMLATALHLSVSYALVKWACQSGRRSPLLLLALVTAVTALCSAWFTWSQRTKAQTPTRGDAEGGDGLGRFSADVALGTTLVLLLFVAVSAVAPLVLSPCE